MNYPIYIAVSIAAGVVLNVLATGSAFSITHISTSLLFTSSLIGLFDVVAGRTNAIRSCILAFILASIPVGRLVNSSWKPIYNQLSATYDLVNNPQYLLVALLVLISTASLVAYQFRKRSFPTLAGLGLCIGSLVSMASFHFIVIHKGYSVEIADIISSKSAILESDIQDLDSVSNTCELLRLQCNVTTLNSILAEPHKYQYGVAKIAQDTRDRSSIMYAWQEMDFNDAGDPEISTAVFFSRNGNAVLIANAKEDARKAKNRHMFILSSLILLFNAIWILLYAFLSTLHQKEP